MVSSYSFLLGDDHYSGLVPVWDLLNHVTGSSNVRLHHDKRRSVLQMIATTDIPPGNEVINNYGPLSSSELLRGYGFVELENCNSNVQVPYGFLLCAVTDALTGKIGRAHV